jgi:hypothetical protein
MRAGASQARKVGDSAGRRVGTFEGRVDESEVYEVKSPAIVERLRVSTLSVINHLANQLPKAAYIRSITLYYKLTRDGRIALL